MSALQWLNRRVLDRAERERVLARCQGFRLVAADASVLMPAIRPCHRTASAAGADQRLFALYLPGSELMLHASVHSAAQSERAMLAESLDELGPDDVLLLDRGYPAAWLVQMLIERGIRFVMRCDSTSGRGAVRAFMRIGQPEAMVRINAPAAYEAAAWGCRQVAPTLRLVAHIAPSDQIRVLATNLGAKEVDASAFGDLYHQRWRIKEAFKRLKHRQHLEAVSGLTQHASIVDLAAKVLADNLASLACIAALAASAARDSTRRCNRSYAAHSIARVLPALLLRVDDVIQTLQRTLAHLAANTQRYIAGRSRPRRAERLKPHPRYAYKG